MERDKKSHGALGRREFLKKGAAIGVTAPGLGALEAGESEAQQAWDREVDFVTIGAGTSGLTILDWQDAILVNQTGRRFYNELENGYDFFSACLADHGDTSKRNGGGPIWAIFNADSVDREDWDPNPPFVDLDGYLFSGDTLGELARNIDNEYQTGPMPPAALQETVARYNSFVDTGSDPDFGRDPLMYKIQTPPFYAAWATPILHDTLTGLRTNPRTQVMDYHGQVIPGLYCSGESQGGFAQHGLGRCVVFGRIAARDAALNGGEA